MHFYHHRVPEQVQNLKPQLMQHKSQLNGWFSNFWNGLKSIFTSSTGDDTGSGFAWHFGRFLGKTVAHFAPVSGMFKASDYNPTPNELITLTQIKNSLNNWLVPIVNEINSTINNDPATGLNTINKIIRQLQLMSAYYFSKPLSISDDAHDYLIEQINTMLLTFEATIENILDGNQINFQKIEGLIENEPTDVFPVQLPSSIQTTGFQYEVEVNATTVIDPTAPINETISVITPVPSGSTTPINTTLPTNTTTNTTTNTVTSTNNFKRLGAFLLLAVVLVWGLSDDKKTN